jgi:hypothetical protein
VLERLLPHPLAVAHRIGKLLGGGVLDQSVLLSPESVSWNETVPCDVGFEVSPVVQARTNVDPLWLLTVTFSVVGVGL